MELTHEYDHIWTSGTDTPHGCKTLSTLVGILSSVDQIDVTQALTEMLGTTSILHRKVNERCFRFL